MIIYFNDKINNFSKFYKNNFSLTQENIQNLMPSCEDIHCNCPNYNFYIKIVKKVTQKKISKNHQFTIWLA